VTEARIEGSIFKDLLDESESSISKSEGNMVNDWKNGRIKKDGTERGLMAPWATPNGFLYTSYNWLRRKPRGPVARASRACSAGLASKACLPGPWAEGPRPGTVAHCSGGFTHALRR
jgi:hypothetical protein